MCLGAIMSYLESQSRAGPLPKSQHKTNSGIGGDFVFHFALFFVVVIVVFFNNEFYFHFCIS